MSFDEDKDRRVMQEEARREQEKEREMDNRETQKKIAENPLDRAQREMTETRDILRQKYEVKECSTCRDFTNHVEVDTPNGKAFQCEVCGTFFEEEEAPIKVKVKRMEKGTATFMEPYVDREGYHEVTVEKYFWKCPCGLVWAARHDAQSCASRGHKAAYERHYGGMMLNNQWVGGRVYVIRSIRKETEKAKEEKAPTDIHCNFCGGELGDVEKQPHGNPNFAEYRTCLSCDYQWAKEYWKWLAEQQGVKA